MFSFVAGDLPEDIRSSLLSNLTTALGASAQEPVLITMDSAADGCSFGAIHFSYYCRNATKVRRSPTAI